jgi:hypothetical protein
MATQHSCIFIQGEVRDAPYLPGLFSDWEDSLVVGMHHSSITTAMPVKHHAKPLSACTVEQLKKKAKAAGVPLSRAGKAKKKSGLIAGIRAKRR